MPSIAPHVHNRTPNSTQSWITPKRILDGLGPFDLDPCASDPQPWPTARVMLTESTDGLREPWHGFVWCNPPYGRELGRWLAKLADHNNGIALTFARTETQAFFDHVWPKAYGLLFLRGRLTFHYPDGSTPKAGHNSGGPSVLIAYGQRALDALRRRRGWGQLVRPCLRASEAVPSLPWPMIERSLA